MIATSIGIEKLELPSRSLYPLCEQDIPGFYSLFSFSGVAKVANEYKELVPMPSWSHCPRLEGFYPRSLQRLTLQGQPSTIAKHSHPFTEVLVPEKGCFCIELIGPRSGKRGSGERIVLEYTPERVQALRIIMNVPHRISLLSSEGVLLSYTDSDVR